MTISIHFIYAPLAPQPSLLNKPMLSGFLLHRKLIVLDSRSEPNDRYHKLGAGLTKAGRVGKVSQVPNETLHPSIYIRHSALTHQPILPLHPQFV